MTFKDEIEGRYYSFTKLGENRWELTVSEEGVDEYECETIRTVQTIRNLNDADVEEIVANYDGYDSIYQIA